MKKKPTATGQQPEQATPVRDFRHSVVVGYLDEYGDAHFVGWLTGPVLQLQSIK
jgi:hypothetical protein